MLPKKHILNLKLTDNRAVLRSKKQFRSRYFVAAYDFAGDQSKLGLIVTKKHFPKAVDRNAVKRKIHAVFAGVLPQFAQLRLIIRPINSSILSMENDKLQQLFLPLIEQITRDKEGHTS